MDARIALQLIEDFPPSIVDVATVLIVCAAGSQSSINRLDGHFRLSDQEKRVMRGELTGPTPEGAPFWAMFRLGKEGAVRQKLNLTLGPAELWTFSMTAEDMALRERLYETLGPSLARKVLTRRFPGGTARPDIENRLARIEEKGGGGFDATSKRSVNPASVQPGRVLRDMLRLVFSGALLEFPANPIGHGAP